MKIFISGVSSELGYHLTEALRQDHLKLEGYSLISGTVAKQDQQFYRHESIQETFEFSKQRDITVKNAIESDVIIFDIRNDSAPQIQFILKVLKHIKLKKQLKLVAISNYMCWSNSKTSEFSTIPSDRDSLLQYSINQNRWKKTQIQTKNYKKRTPHPMFVYNYLLEQQILELTHHNKFITPHILCAGVLYGKSGFDLKQIIQAGIKCKPNKISNLLKNTQWNIKKTLPFTKIDQILQKLQSIVYADSNQKSAVYQFLCDTKCQSIRQVIDKVNQVCGYIQSQTQEQSKQTGRNQTNFKQINSQFPSLKPTSQNTQGSNLLVIPALQGLSNPSSQRSSSCLPFYSPALPILQLESHGNKRMFSFLVDMKVKDQNVRKRNSQSKLISSNDSVIDEKQLLSSNEQDNMIKLTVEQQRINQISKKQRLFSKWVESMIEEFIQHYDIQFKHFLVSEQLFANKQSLQHEDKSQNKQNKLPSKYFNLDKHELNKILHSLVQSGQLSNQRLLTPEQDKKKLNKKPQSRQSSKKQRYQNFIPEIMKSFFTHHKLSNYTICIKHQLIEKVLNLLDQPEFEDFKNIDFIYITKKQIKQGNIDHIQYNINSNKFGQTVYVDSDEYNKIFGIQDKRCLTSQSQTKSNGQKVIQIQPKSSRKKNRQTAHKNQNDQENINLQEIKVNLISQYLLDNLIVYAAQAKQQLVLKNKLTFEKPNKQSNSTKSGQSIEAKEKIKQFLNQLKLIRQRQLAEQAEQDQISL